MTQATITGGGSNFRRDDKDRRPGKPVYLGERPANRPMADELGSGRATSTLAAAVDGQDTRRRRQRAPTYFRNLCGLKLFSWEQDQ